MIYRRTYRGDGPVNIDEALAETMSVIRAKMDPEASPVDGAPVYILKTGEIWVPIEDERRDA